MFPTSWRVQPDVTAALAVVAFVLVLCLLARSVSSASQMAPDDTQNASNGKALLNQSLEWHRLADSTGVPLFAYRHTVFALAYLNAARLTTPDDQLQRNGTDIFKYAQKLEHRLVALSKKISKTCAPSNPAQEKTTGVSWI